MASPNDYASAGIPAANGTGGYPRLPDYRDGSVSGAQPVAPGGQAGGGYAQGTTRSAGQPTFTPTFTANGFPSGQAGGFGQPGQQEAAGYAPPSGYAVAPSPGAQAYQPAAGQANGYRAANGPEWADGYPRDGYAGQQPGQSAPGYQQVPGYAPAGQQVPGYAQAGQQVPGYAQAGQQEQGQQGYWDQEQQPRGNWT
jgi:hypothetical protein